MLQEPPLYCELNDKVLVSEHMKFLFFLIISSVLAVSQLQAQPNPQMALEKLKSSGLVTLHVVKKVKSDLMGTESQLPGKIFLAKDRFRWDTNGAETSSIIYDGSNLWTIQQPPKGFKAAAQVTRMKMSSQTENQIFLKKLLQDKLDKNFSISKKSEDKKKKAWRFYLKPTELNSVTNQLEILVANEGNLIEVSYEDEIQNKIIIEIEKIKKTAEIPKEMFKYSPPKGTQVNEL